MNQPDSESQDLDLGEMETEEEYSFPPAERRVIAQPVDLSVQTLVEQWKSKTLVLPEIQREYVWDNGKASRLIESLILNIPVPILYFAETAEAKYEVIDGHQRVNSIARYIANEFPLSGLGVLGEYKNLRYHQLPEREQRFLKMRTLRAIIIAVESHPNMKFEVFERLNSGSILLNAQELRNSIYRGPFNKLLRELVKDEVFRRLLGTRTPRKRMVDEELLLRFFALRARFETYKTPLKQFLNSYMGSVRDAGQQELAAARELFETTVRRVDTLIGDCAFRTADAQGRALERQLNRALFDSHMLVCSWVKGEVSNHQRPAIRRELAGLYERPDFLDAIQRATGDRSRTYKRVGDTAAAFERAGIPVAMPFKLPL